MTDKSKKLIEEFLDGRLTRKDVTMDSFADMSDEFIEMVIEDHIWAEENVMIPYWTEDLDEDLAEFLKERFNITVDINTLSDKEFSELYRKVCRIEIAEAGKISENDEPISELGDLASSVVTYMGYQFREGGRRWDGRE